MDKSPTRAMEVSLALGGGGSRGYSHIGVIRQLEFAGFIIKGVAGTSAGGIIACMYAAGYSPDDMEKLVERIDQNKLFTFSSNEGPSLLGLANATKILDELFGDRTFADLKKPCAVVAVDINSPQEVVLNKGRLVDAILATIAVPGIFPPRSMGEHALVDGAVLDPVPVTIARSMFPRLPVIAVVLSPPMEKPGRSPHIPLPVKVPTPIAERITHLRVAQALNVFMQSVDIGQRMITELRLKVDEPDVIIRPRVDDIGLLDRVDIKKLIQKGEEATIESLQEIFASVSWVNRMSRRFFPKGNRMGKVIRTQ